MTLLDLIQCLALLFIAYGAALLTVAYLDVGEKVDRLASELDRHRRGCDE